MSEEDPDYAFAALGFACALIPGSFILYWPIKAAIMIAPLLYPYSLFSLIFN